MVNLWSPDPQQGRCDGEIGPVSSSSLTTIEGSSSDSENEDLANNGYELLPMTPLEDLQLDSDEEEEATDSDQEDDVQTGDTEFASHQSLEINKEEVLSPSCDSESNILQRQEMDPELMEQVKTAMSGFSLPLTAVPSWAFHVPEDEWRSHLVERMQCIQRGAKPHSSSDNNALNNKNGN